MSSNRTEARDWQVRWKDEREALRGALAGLQFDGPKVLGGDMFGATGAICLRCGALVMLGDAEEREGRATERGVRLHVGWHEASAT